MYKARQKAARKKKIGNEVMRHWKYSFNFMHIRILCFNLTETKDCFVSVVCNEG